MADGRGSPGPASADSILTPDINAAAQAPPPRPGAPLPDLARTGAALANPANRSAALTVLTVLAVLYTLFFARDFLLPITVALLLDLLLSPVVRALARARVPTPLGAALVVLLLIGALGAGGYALADPVQHWVQRAPTTLATAQRKLRTLLRPVQQVANTAERAANASSGVAGPSARPTPEVVVKGPSLASRAFGTTQRLLGAALEVVVLLYFLLAAGDLFLQKLVKVLPRPGAKETAVEVAREVEGTVSRYLLTTAALNVGEGVVVAGAMYLIGMPSPLLWGVLVALLEFVPYLGAATMVVLLSLAGFTAFEGVGSALVAPATFLAINFVQAYVIAPVLLAKRLTLNPVAVFVGLTFWWFLWGIPGAFVAVPLLAAFKTVCDHVPALAAVGEFLGQRDASERRHAVR